MSAAPILRAENLRVGYGGKPVLLDVSIELNPNEVLCIIEHNLDIVQGISDRIAFLDQGRLLAEGDPKTILSDPALAAIYFGERAV